MTSTAWIGLGGLTATLVLAIIAGAIAFGRLTANVANLTAVVQRLVSDSRIDGDAVIEMRGLVNMLREAVDGLQKTLRNGLGQRMTNCERRLDILETEHRRNHAGSAV
jgi:hypothetical protein